MTTSIFFSARRKKLIKKAELLFPAISLLSKTMFFELQEKFPTLITIEEKEWDFYIRIGALWAATIGLQRLKNINARTKSSLSAIYGHSVNDWNNNWNIAFKECGDYFYNNIEKSEKLAEYEINPKFRISDAIGLWIVKNLLHHHPEKQEEINLIRPIGLLLTHEFLQWWD